MLLARLRRHLGLVLAFLLASAFPQIVAAQSQEFKEWTELEQEVLRLQSSRGFLFSIALQNAALRIPDDIRELGKPTVISPQALADAFAAGQMLAEQLEKDWASHSIKVRPVVDVSGKLFSPTSSTDWVKEIDLVNADFRSTIIDEIRFSGVTISGANFENAVLNNVQFVAVKGDPQTATDANGKFVGTNYVNFSEIAGEGVIFQLSSLKSAFFYSARLTNSKFYDGTDLKGAKFIDADLTGSEFSGVNLSGALFERANLSGVIFEPDPDKLPVLSSLAYAQNTHLLTYKKSPEALTELRVAAEESGFAGLARNLVAAIQRTENRRLWSEGDISDKAMALLERILIEWPTDWGAQPFRPAWIILIGVLGFGLIYAACLTRRVFPGGAIYLIDESIAREAIGRKTLARLAPMDAIRRGLYISALAAFHIGWQGSELRGWLTRVQSDNYYYVARGWPRICLGVQSLVSTYLLILWMFVYLGKPFR